VCRQATYILRLTISRLNCDCRTGSDREGHIPEAGEREALQLRRRASSGNAVRSAGDGMRTLARLLVCATCSPWEMTLEITQQGVAAESTDLDRDAIVACRRARADVAAAGDAEASAGGEGQTLAVDYTGRAAAPTGLLLCDAALFTDRVPSSQRLCGESMGARPRGKSARVAGDCDGSAVAERSTERSPD